MAAQKTVTPDFISDADMKRMEKLGKVQSPDFISDAEAYIPPAGAPNPAVNEIMTRMLPEDALAAKGTQSAIHAGEGFAVPGAVLGAAKQPAAAALRSGATSLEKSSIKQQVKALGGGTPGFTKEARLTAEEVAPDLVKTGEWASTGKRYTALEDRRIENARSEWKAAADSIPRNAEIVTTPIIEGLEAKLGKRTLQGGEGQAMEMGSNAELKDALEKIRGLGTKDRPNVGSFTEVKKYLDELDNQVQAMGGWNAVGSDRAKVNELKDIANIIRDTSSKFDDRLAKANAELSMRLKVDKVLQMQEEAQRAAGYKSPGFTSHLIAGGIGGAAGGLEGAIIGEGINLLGKGIQKANQSRGVSSARAVLADKMSSGARSMADRLNPRYRGLLEAGEPLPYGGQDLGSGIIRSEPRPVRGQLPASTELELPERSPNISNTGEYGSYIGNDSYVKGVPAQPPEVNPEADAWWRLSRAKELRKK